MKRSVNVRVCWGRDAVIKCVCVCVCGGGFVMRSVNVCVCVGGGGPDAVS